MKMMLIPVLTKASNVMVNSYMLGKTILSPSKVGVVDGALIIQWGRH